MATIEQDKKALLRFVDEYPGGCWRELLAPMGAAVGRICAGAAGAGWDEEQPAPEGGAQLLEMARAELAALPVPRRLWDEVLEPLLAMAERATDSELQEAMERVCSATGRGSDVTAGAAAAVRAVQAVKPLLSLTGHDAYGAAAGVAGDAYRTLRDIYHDIMERDRLILESVRDENAWMERVMQRVLANTTVLGEIRAAAGNPETNEELVRLVRRSIVARDREVTQLRRLEKHLGWPEGDEQGLADVLIECWDDRDRLAEAADNFVVGWDTKNYGHIGALEKKLRAALKASPVGSALRKGGGREDAESEVTQSPYSEELEHMRRESADPELLAWAEMVERQVAVALEQSRCVKEPSADDETPAVDVRARPGDRANIISALRTGLACDVHVKNARGDVVGIHVLEQGAEMPRQVVADQDLVVAWDQHSEGICDALGPYYSDDGSGFDYDKMIIGVKRLREQSEALQRLLSIHETAWPHDVSVQAAKCVEVLAKSCTSSYCANGLFAAAGGSCPSCGPTAFWKGPTEPDVG